MDINALLPRIEAAQKAGASVLLKWDGERHTNRCTVLVTYPAANWSRRSDTDNPEGALREGLAELRQILEADC